ncbi:muscle-specific protein 300 kDa-like isoform X7 [Babylonia areolata]|uniref:muscle-specific protein 300 kDa-like isoform X7 n=1 Tax=Babylonia areolata TaxID=304850 RepID=UPI003FD2E3FC
MDRRGSGSSQSDGTTSTPDSPRGLGRGMAASGNGGGGIQNVIQGLQNEQERVQKKTFTNWMNTYLCKRSPPIKVEDLFEEIKDGTVLLSLLEVLSGDKLPMEKGTKLRRPHHIANITTALNYLEKRQIKMVNINATSVADGKPAIVLGLVWTIILYFQIEETISQVPDMADGTTKKKQALPKQSLLAWAEGVLGSKYGLKIKDFGKSWKDGVAFNAMIHNIRPDLVDMDSVRAQQSRTNLEHAFSTAEDQLGIARLLDPEDVDVDRPDEKSIMTYVAQFLKAYPDAGDPNFKGLPGDDMSTPDKEQQAYDSLMTWLNTDAVEFLANSQDPVSNRQAEFMDYIGFKTEFDRREPLYKKIGDKVTSGQALKLTSSHWQALDDRWKEVEDQTRRWLLKLDANLPGKLGKFGRWLYDAEEMLRRERDLLAEPQDDPSQLAEAFRQHKEFFKELDSWQQFFTKTKREGRFEGELLHAPHMDLMTKRLEAVSSGAGNHHKHMEYLLCRFDLLGYIEAAEGKVVVWTGKHGHQEDVEATLQDFVDTVETQQLVQTVQKTQTELKKLAEAYKKINKEEAPKVDAFQTEASERWKKVAADIQGVKPSLEEVIKAWRNYNACVDVLTVWFTDGDQALASGTPEEVEEFFKDSAQYEDRLKMLNDSGGFLLGVVTDPVAEEIRERLEEMNAQCPDLLSSFEQFRETEVIGRARSEYDEGVEQMEKWLDGAQGVLNQQVPCVHADLKEHLLQLDEVNGELVQVESDFKVTTKTAQSLVKDSSQEVVDVMLATLNQHKEAIVKMRKEVPERIKYLKAVLPNVESLETGVLDMEKWLAFGEQLLASHKLDPTAEASEARLERHKTFFAETTYQKSILESKNKVYQKISSTKPKLKNVDFTPAENLMTTINTRFQECVSSAKEWEKRLDGVARLWKSLLQRQQQLQEWLDSAQAILDDNEDDSESLIRKHKSFFERADQKRLQEYLSNGQEILRQLEPEDQSPLEDSLRAMEDRWKEVMGAAPIRLVKLEFVLPEERFEQHMTKAEQTLQHSQQQLAANTNVRDALHKHKQFFEQGVFRSTCEKCLEQMNNYSTQLGKLDPSDNSLEERYQEHLDRWNRLTGWADRLQTDLKQLPERWKDYNQKVQGLSEWMNNVEKLVNSMGQENISSDEYRDLLAKFQKEMRNMDKQAEEGRQLKTSLEELLQDSPDSDGTEERQRLQELTARLQGLRPAMEATMGKSSIFTKGYEFRDSVDRRAHWLDEAQRQVMEDPAIDSLEDARAYLHEHEALLTKLESEKGSIQKDIEQGKRLAQERNAPAFISQTTADLERKWKDTNELAQAKHAKLKEKVKDWEKYEAEKASLLQYLKKAEAELEKPQETLAQEIAQKELESKQELQSALHKLKGSVGEMTKLNTALCEGASRERQGPLKGEVTDMDRRLDSVGERLNAKLADLEMAIAKWNEYYKRLNNFCDWLNQQEAKLTEVLDNKQDTPDEQLKKSEAISGQVLENHITLENLEKDAKGLTQNFRSRETAALKSKLTSVRRQWESLCSRAKDRSTALSGNVAHWQRYQTLHEQLIPWIEKAENYCATELPKCSSLEEAKDLYDLHQAFLRECEENMPIFDKMSTEAGYLMEQPNMARDLAAIQKRWSGILSNSEDRSHQLEKMLGAWSAYTSELESFQENLDRLQGRLASDPNVGTTDVQVLEHELALAKTLQEEVRSQQPHLNALQRQFEQLAPHASPEGLQVLRSKQDSVRGSFEDASAAVAERQQTLASALQHRRDFYGRLNDMEKWVKKMQRKLDSGSEIYADEVGDTLAKLKVLRKECGEQDPAFQALQQEFKDLIQNCSEEEKAVLMDRFDKLVEGYTRMEDLIGEREDLCQQWGQYSQTHKAAQAKLKGLQTQLAAPDIQEEEVARILEEIEEVKKTLSPWSREAEALDEKMTSAQMVIKDRPSQRSLHFGSELQSLEQLCDSVGQSAAQKEEHLGEVQQLRTDFGARRDALLYALHALQDRAHSTKAGESSLQGVRDLIRDIEGIRDDVFAHNPDYEQLRELGRQIMHADPLKAGEIQSQLSQVSELWEGLQNKLGEQHQYYSSVANQWQAYNDAKRGVGRVLEAVSPLAEDSKAYTNQNDVRRALEQHKNAEFELHANQSQLDHMNTKGMQLLEELRSVPNFDPSVMEHDLDEVNLQWENTNKAIEDHKENLEAQLVCWDQVMTGKDEVTLWVNSMLSKLDDSCRHFDDAVSVESRLNKFKEEAPYYEEVMTEVAQKIADLKELNQGQSIPSLESTQRDLEEKFERAHSLANQLSATMADFSEEQRGLHGAMDQETEWLNQLKDLLSRCDDMSGEDRDIIARLSDCKALQEDLASHKKKVAAIQDKTAALLSKYPSVEMSSLAKDANVLAKKLESMVGRAERIEDTLLGALEQHCLEAQQQQERWLSAAKEKVAWCGDLGGDRYSVEAKLSTMKELTKNMEEGERKRAEALARLEAVRSVLPRARLTDLEHRSKTLEKDWNHLVGQMDQTQDKLEGSVKQWEAYDTQHEALSQWLRDTEAYLRAEATLKPDLTTKKKQLDFFKSLEEKVLSRRKEFDNMRDMAQKISHSSGDTRTASYANQLVSRFQTLASAVREQVEQSEKNVEDHENFTQRHKNCVDWLKKAHKQLDSCSKTVGDEDSLKEHLAIVKDLLTDKEQGLALFNAALESGEKLYPNTSNEGREEVRRELRSMRDSWESFTDSLNDTQRALESSRMQWSSFDENFEQLMSWVSDMEAQVVAEPELKATLQEKKAQLQGLKTRCQDILSHQTMLDSISDKGTALASAQVHKRIQQLNTKYNTLCSKAQAQVRKAESGVEQHQALQDSTQACRDWMSVAQDRLAVCAETGGDRQSLHNRLERLKDLINTQREGEAKLKAAQRDSDKTLPQTSTAGQAAIQREMATLQQEWDSLTGRMASTQKSLQTAVQAVEAYDNSCDALSRWIRDTESQLKDYEMKSTLPEKQAQVEKLKKVQQQISSKQSEIDELQTMASQVQGSDIRLNNYSSQLMSRYEALKTTARDVIGRWQEFVDDHMTYQNNYTKCAEWVATLQKRLKVCGDLAGDKQDVEDRLIKLQEMIAEKEEGASMIHQTVDSGERLFPNTAAEGRDIIRQELRSLREQWDQMGDEVVETQRRLDSNLTQWSSYDENFEAFQKWMLDVEVKLQQDAELKATLPEKKAQLQNHKVLHQDILSRKHIMENLSEKAQALSRSSPSAKVSKFVGELQGKYDKVCSLSKSVLERLEQSMKDHQQYQDGSHDFQDWLNAARDKLDMCVDRSGDKMSLQAKRERLREFSTGLAEGESKLRSVKELADRTGSNTSPQGQDVLQREMDHLHREWEDYCSRLRGAEQALEQTMEQWGSFEGTCEECSRWLKNMENSVRSQELRNTLQEKQAQVDKLKKQREEILSKQGMIDRFTDEAQNLMHTSSDVRLSTQVTQLTTRYQGLLSLTKELISKWEKYVADHQVFDSRLSEYNDWMQQAHQKLEQCLQPVGDQESMEEKRALIQMLLSEKEHGFQRLNGTVDSGEKLFPDTASAGREKVRQDLRRAKEDWERLFSGLNEAQRRVDAFLMRWASYVDGQDSLSRWMGETEAALRADMELRNSLQEKRQQLQNYRSVLQDITSHQRLVDSVVEKAQGVLQSTSNPDVASFITTINSRYEKLAADAKAMIGRCEQHVMTHQQYQESQQGAVDWLSLMKDKLCLCSDTSGDSTTIRTKLDRLQELINQLGEGQMKVKECERDAHDTMDTTALKGRQVLQSEMDVLKLDWEDYSHKLHSLKDSLERALHYWRIYEEKYEHIQGWIKSMEKQVKDCSLKSTLGEKQEQLKKYQGCAEEITEQEAAVVVEARKLGELESELLQEMKRQQGDVDKFTDEAQTLQQLTSESRVGNFVSQLTARYQGLLVTTKEIIKRCEQNVEDHKTFVSKFADASQWLNKAKEKFATCSDTGGARTELEDRLEKIQELVRDRDAGLSKLNSCVESGERLYASTAPDGCEVIRQELRKLKQGWDGLYDDLSALQRRLEVSLVQWTSFNESYGQVEKWLRSMESQLEGPVPLRSTLEEKKTQLHNFKVILQDVQSYQRVIDSISDKAETLAHASSDPQLARFISTTTARYQKLCAAAKDRVQQYEDIVNNHQEYNDSYNSCVEWLNSAREKLSACSDVSGDRHAIKGRLDKIQDILETKMEGEPKVQHVISLAQNVLPHTAPQGRDVIIRDSDALRNDWEAFMLALAKTKSDLESCMDQWKEFETWEGKCGGWLKEVEARLREVDLRASLPEKQTQLEKLKALQKEINEHEKDLDVLSDSAQELMQVSADSRVVSQASQLATRYQTAVINTKELCRRWEQYVADHKSYLEAVDRCRSWLSDMETKVSTVLDTSGDKTTVQDRLANIQELLSEKEEGLHRLQIALDNLQMVLPNTSVAGRETMRRDMQALQQDYDALSGRLMEARSSQEGMLAQWTGVR